MDGTINYPGQALYYTGVGSRDTPDAIMQLMAIIARKLGAAGWCLRSGGAVGADSAFYEGCIFENCLREIYLPWPDFNGSREPFRGISEAAFATAMVVHPRWHRLSQGAQKLHARNVHQVLGADLKTPSKFLVCWTPGGEAVGGTRTAIVVAEQNNIPVYNLASREFPFAEWGV